MSVNGVDIDLEDFSSVNLNSHRFLLLGNGFSIGVDRGFSYGSLYTAAQAKGLLKQKEMELFSSFNTTDFEYLLRKLSQASTVNKILDIDHMTPQTKYNLIKNSLIGSVNHVHPQLATLNRDWLESASEFLAKMHSVFSLNYDLLIYWIAAYKNFDGFTDYFWAGKLNFDPTDTVLWYQGKTQLYYPHGALFIYEDNNGDIYKVRNSDKSVLERIGEYLADYSIPIFVSEGTSDEKLRKIKTNLYLSFAYKRIKECKNGLIVFGTSLSSQDAHIVKAISESAVDRIAFGIYVGSKDPFEVESEKARVKVLFKDKKITWTFFDSSTCPLAYPG
ncbi:MULTISPECIES: DUF4917 family protein [Deinococcus]|uniref:DUF4917 family protein n=1 Tax=Deinococcus rufus TaxID=2136097 RepID=A0ABV7ZA01_9DEIO|nr:DUF4917 family protein [Deinococcus sp. AB2017081]WQE97468.1 DUF4917 family protein [Deinococcus sp. AB2017081]WQE97492.1 DUF4917 family protein [Deinococcus sp. AB2017081]